MKKSKESPIKIENSFFAGSLKFYQNLAVSLTLRTVGKLHSELYGSAFYGRKFHLK